MSSVMKAFDEQLIIAFGNAVLKNMGLVGYIAIKLYLKEEKGLRIEDLPNKTEEFLNGLKEILGDGVKPIEETTLQDLCERLKIERNRNLLFEDEIKRLREYYLNLLKKLPQFQRTEVITFNY